MASWRNKITKSGTFWFFIVFVGLLFFYRYHHTSFYVPKGLHQWRQCVGASYAKNYYNYNLDISEARIYNHISQDETSDVTFVEMPVLYYSVAVLYEIFGPHDSVFRIFNALILLVGLFLLFKTLRFYLKDIFWSLIIVVIIFTSPTLVYYANGFLPNTTAFGFVFIALYFLHKAILKDKNSYLYLSSLFYLLAGTSKVTSLISLLALIGAFTLMQLFDKEFRDKYQFQKFIVPAVIPLAGVFVWYYFVEWFNSNYGGTISPVTIRPIWVLSAEVIAKTWDKIANVWLNSYYHVSLQIIALISFLGTLIFFKKSNRFLTVVTTLSILGSTAFFFLFFRSLFNHDYYLINVFILIVFSLAGGAIMLKNHLPKLYNSVILKILLVILVGFYANECRQRIKIKHDGYHNYHHKTRYSGFVGIEEYNRDTLGIKPQDLVIAMPDPSNNISLYLMDQPGFTEFGISHVKGAERIDYLISRGAEYLFVSHKKVYKEDKYNYLKPYLKYKIGDYKNIDIYDLRPFKDK